MLASHGHPVVATAPLGNGEAAESGLGVPYLPVTFGTAVESASLV